MAPHKGLIEQPSLWNSSFSHQPEDAHLKPLLEKAISELEDRLGIFCGSDVDEKDIDSDIFLKLGHYSLSLGCPSVSTYTIL